MEPCSFPTRSILRRHLAEIRRFRFPICRIPSPGDRTLGKTLPPHPPKANQNHLNLQFCLVGTNRLDAQTTCCSQDNLVPGLSRIRTEESYRELFVTTRLSRQIGLTSHQFRLPIPNLSNEIQHPHHPNRYNWVFACEKKQVSQAHTTI